MTNMSPKISFIVCSRNDNYMGNPMWRLETTVNYLIKNLVKVDRVQEAEIIIADWGSSTPIRDVLNIDRAGKDIVRFICIPPSIAKKCQKDSPFSEVHSLNAAARVAKGNYIGRIDQDTLVGEKFLRWFFEVLGHSSQGGSDYENAILFANRKSIPYRFSVQCPKFAYVEKYIEDYGDALKVWNYNPHYPDLFWTSYVGIFLLTKKIWEECGGYNETMIYYDWMEVEMIIRLQTKYQMVDLGKIVDYDFFHLDHYQEKPSWSGILHPRVHASTKSNADMDLTKTPDEFHPNSLDWGLRTYHLTVSPPHGERPNGVDKGMVKSQGSFFGFISLVTSSKIQGILDDINAAVFKVVMPRLEKIKDFVNTWIYRFNLVKETVSGKSLIHWPTLIMGLWTSKRYARLERLKNN
ncbi:hypothetical protein [Candidatus Nitronereus thalassa]|uniref:Glycosyltransferase 2-like domain-containing protein n=1 Tax=Candidatus Nitronereus thalassa TaxID=3020898 RepID=A0ABU3K581_9BACT|nr:hypothetical protein [Candidatus Nitronereus thalassa]MDT7041529.1 hypothetical protein [Candidatus Nitronereus thalassa]